MTASVLSTLPLPLFIRGKVRDVYDLGDQLLMVASDRISAFDYVLPTPVPDKGKILTQISAWWFRQVEDIVPNHLISADVNEFPSSLRGYREQLEGRAMLVKKTNKIMIECVVRGYLAGSGWKEYKQDGSVCGIRLPEGLKESDRLPEPIFTPATKEERGKHDENIPFERMAEIIGKPLAETLRDRSLALYIKAARVAESKGLILCDTKFEFGQLNGQVTLIDEILTPDSSRFWDKTQYRAGQSQDSFDKQFVRDYLESIHWNKQPPVPELPADVVRKTREKYADAYQRLTGKAFR
ncbi:MAG: phosphoribosylaminoimidazolesuccinocarboxamide synthase [Elusimicrobia bacterium RIFCSPLOWO2_01_FULL_59_12]|nr:MAG: phosphoribosylaminoimidazolesuccinocarboxamide synthase [Elusimicrobia bacterium RIFCSPLOWO2_01_FULL_59_12]